MRDFAADRKLIEQATPGPWEVEPADTEEEYPGVEASNGRQTIVMWSDDDHDDDGGIQGPTKAIRNANAALIAACPTGWLAALDRIDELEAENARLLKQMKCYHSDPDNSGQCIYCGFVLDGD